jgi:hypothetical protein
MNVRTLLNFEGNEAACDVIEGFFVTMRKSILSEGLAISRQVSGRIPDNSHFDSPGLSGLREEQVTRSDISITKRVGKDFSLVIKHPAAFTALLGSLVKRFPCYALVRNPLAVLASWNSVAAQFEQGHAPVAESLDAELKTHLARTAGKMERQLYLLSWYFLRYQQILPPESILRYEDIISSGGGILNVVASSAKQLNEKLENRNQNSVYERGLMEQAGSALLDSNGPYWDFYSREDVRRLITYRSQFV